MGRKLVKQPLFTIVYLSFVLMIVAPIVYTIGTAFFSEKIGVELTQAFQGRTIFLLLKSSLIAAIIAFFSTIIGTFLGFLLYKTKIPFQGFFKVSLLIPLLISPYIFAVAWKDIFLFFFRDSTILPSYLTCILVMIIVFSPLAMLITGSAFMHINKQFEESALMVTSFRKMILKVILPLIKPSLISSFVLIFIFSISEFSVPALFGVKVFTTEIFTQFSAFYNHSMAILQSLLLILICVFLLYAERKHLADLPFLSIGSKGSSSKIYVLKKGEFFSLSFLFLWLSVSMIFPVTILFIQSFKNGVGAFIQAFDLMMPTFIDSIALSFVAALLIVFVGFVAAFSASNKPDLRMGKSFNYLLLFVFAVPSTILGISLIKFYNQPGLEMIYTTYAIILIAFVGKFSFIAAKIIGDALKGYPKSLDEAARIAGATFSIRIRKILIPMILPVLFLAFMVAFIFSLGDLGTSIMLYPPGTELMPIKVFTIMANAPQDLINSMTLIVFLTTLILIIGLYMIAKLMIRKYNCAYD